MRPYTNSILSVALIFSIGSVLGCDSSKPTASKTPGAVATNLPLATNTQSATYFVEGMV